MKCLLFNVAVRSDQERTLGIYRIAHHMREHTIDTEVIDWASFWNIEQLKTLVYSRSPNKIRLIGFSHLFSHWTPVLEKFCEWICKTFPHIKIVSGSGSPPLFKSSFIHYYVAGYGENAVIELFKYILGNGPRPKFSLNKVNGAPIIYANDHYPAYPIPKLLVKYEKRDFIESDEWGLIEFSRGCKFQCAFCNYPILGVKGDYSRDASDFDLQIRDAYDKFGICNYGIVDETFNDRTEKITKFADVVEQLPFTPWFNAYIRADLLISRGAKEKNELKRMNVRGHFYGIESFNTASAKAVGKGMDGERLKDGLLEIRRDFENDGVGLYRGNISLIAGLPYESVDSLNNTIDWLVKNWQGQAAQMHPLVIYVNDLIKPSKFSLDYKKYGYSEKKILSDDSVSSSNYYLDKETLRWKNEYMDEDIANTVTDKLLDLKDKNDFRLQGFKLAGRFLDTKTLQERLALRSLKFQNYKFKSLDTYINKKLNLSG